MVGFDFVQNSAHFRPFMVNAGIVQIALLNVPSFRDWNPWMVPVEIVQKIEKERLNLKILEETDFERQFANNYRNKQGR